MSEHVLVPGITRKQFMLEMHGEQNPVAESVPAEVTEPDYNRKYEKPRRRGGSLKRRGSVRNVH